MGFMSVIGPCFGCGRVFSFNADLVPSIRIDGKREPVCETCIERANAQRAEMGLEPHRILPGAYEPEEVS